MATLKLKKPAPGAPSSPATVRRAPLRSGGVKPARPTLAQAEAERARQRAESTPPPRPERADAPPRAGRAAPAAPGRQRSDAPRPSSRTEAGQPPRGPGRPGAERSPRDPNRTSERPTLRDPAREPSSDRRPPRTNDSGAPRPSARPSQRPPPRPAQARTTGGAPPEELNPRLSKRMSELGLASRREADEWIEQGYVRVDGEVVDQLGARVRPEQQITIDPQARLEQAQRVTILLHKPLGYVSGQAEDGHAPAFTLVTAANRWATDGSKQRFNASQLKHLVPAGRLDLDSTGLLVLTQDGRVAKLLIGEDSPVEKEYVVRVQWTARPELTDLKQHFPPEALARLRHGLALDGEKLKPAKVSWQNEQHLRFVLREGKKRQIRRMCELVGLKVESLKRIRIGRVGLGELPPGQWRYLGPFENFL
ncbi:putative arginine/proline rich protein [Methylibium petroleiphilum PM1]|uniref:Dual-specificity RNA pseudouridine synthase RluF n=1 Tax=Methylibium petroleiphilum (strain ATCC BAA-1232 / LMG 22953 / PM1) TaxID=420662 RepID=A2SHF2_METPP|nr:pseudouridine synthase [Methylibium petroleiphilum]ABM94991.1 putative arginine/proline rich protein [Methylibium petroleiphilum PM1]